LGPEHVVDKLVLDEEAWVEGLREMEDNCLLPLCRDARDIRWKESACAEEVRWALLQCRLKQIHEENDVVSIHGLSVSPLETRAILREPLLIQHIGARNEHDGRMASLLDEVGLPLNAMERFPHEFSGGQRQRIGLARALMLGPRVMVADEPVSALDVSIRSQILNLMKRLQAEYSMATIVISHDLAVVKYLADRIGVMYLGKLVEVVGADDIYERPAHPYTQALINSIALADPEPKRDQSDAGSLVFRASCPAR
jgi:ABC-type oligopeptide transport system ATPase subunit